MNCDSISMNKSAISSGMLDSVIVFLTGWKASYISVCCSGSKSWMNVTNVSLSRYMDIFGTNLESFRSPVKYALNVSSAVSIKGFGLTSSGIIVMCSKAHG